MRIIKHLIAGMKLALGLHRPGHNLLILPDDIFLVSFPKSGNTWARFLLANLLHPEQTITFTNLHRFVPDYLTGATKRDLDRTPRPRVIKSHECFERRYPRVIYIVRDPRDVAVSLYHYHRKLRKIEDDASIERFVDRFVSGETYPYGSWGQNVLTWLGTREGDPRFLLVRYEDMVADTGRELRKIAAFLGKQVTAEEIARSVERSSAGQLRKMERVQSNRSRLTKDSRQDLSFVRAANAGGWRSELSAPLVTKIETAWAPLMRHLGYQLVTRDAGMVADFPILSLAGKVEARR